MTVLTKAEELTDPLSAHGPARSTVTGAPLSAEELNKIDAYWRACNYLALGMIYLQANPLLREPLKPEHIKSRLLGHWGSSPGLAFIYTHLSRLIRKHDAEMIFLAGPGHGAPGVLAPIYLEGTYSEIYPEKSQDEKGLRDFFKQFSFPGGIGSHCTPETPGIHSRGRRTGVCPLARLRSRVRQSQPDRGEPWWVTAKRKPARWRPRGISASFSIRFAMGQYFRSFTSTDTRSTTRPCWHGSRTRNWRICCAATAGIPTSLRDPSTTACIRQWQRRWSVAWRRSGHIRQSAGRAALRPGRAGRWWCCDRQRAGEHRRRWTDNRIEAFWRSHQVPLADVKTNPQRLRILENWMRSLKPEELFDESGRLRPELAEVAPSGSAAYERQSSCQWRPQEEAAPARLSGLCDQNRSSRRTPKWRTCRRSAFFCAMS